MDGWTDGWRDGRTDRRTDRRTDGRKERRDERIDIDEGTVVLKRLGVSTKIFRGRTQ